MTLSAINWLEAGAVAAGLAYVVLAAREHISCWAFGILNALLSILVFLHARLYAESFLYLYYVFAGIYGWMSWKKNQARAGQPLAIHTWTLIRHAQFLVLGAALSAALGWALSAFTNAQFPFLDSHITIFSFLATYLVTRKVLSNWIYWVLIDAVSAGVYWVRDLRLYAILMVTYTLIAVYGYLHWRKLYEKQINRQT
ncbi:MAG: nicotinamide mononucleotide transporter [Haliscomenobacter sp.]|nr:nicotinamide mononucleotide transporter [Haliscomenobacter sp.]MBK7475867.1 nicotinamide mononucleotide transporter [Haliscomenobacter sp.]MBK8880553.1 nicotinamide mononucleotide transporter [Haliscomenobacter sp.]